MYAFQYLCRVVVIDDVVVAAAAAAAAAAAVVVVVAAAFCEFFEHGRRQIIIVASRYLDVRFPVGIMSIKPMRSVIQKQFHPGVDVVVVHDEFFSIVIRKGSLQRIVRTAVIIALSSGVLVNVARCCCCCCCCCLEVRIIVVHDRVPIVAWLIKNDVGSVRMIIWQRAEIDLIIGDVIRVKSFQMDFSPHPIGHPPVRSPPYVIEELPRFVAVFVIFVICATVTTVTDRSVLMIFEYHRDVWSVVGNEKRS